MSLKGRATIGKEGYREYIDSPEWQEVRKRFWNSKLPKECYICGRSDRSRDLHHKTYKNLGNECLRDLVPVCRECHYSIHDHQKKTNQGIWGSTNVVRRRNKKNRNFVIRSNMKEITIATDGSCLTNPGPAAWAWYMDENNWASGFFPNATNNVSELSGILNALKAVKDYDGQVKIISDSQYAIKSITVWSAGWLIRGWKTSTGKQVANLEIIKEAHELYLSCPHVKIEWVKGHNNHPLNEQADRIAGETARNQGSETGPSLCISKF